MKIDNLRSIPGWPAYKVGPDGSLWSCWRKGPNSLMTDKWKMLNPCTDEDGYRIVTLVRYVLGERIVLCKRVSSMVLTAFRGKRPRGLIVRHLDGNPANDSVTNLKWGTFLENAADRDRHGNTRRGCLSATFKVSDSVIVYVRSMAGKLTHRELSEMFDLSLSTIYRIIHREQRFKESK